MKQHVVKSVRTLMKDRLIAGLLGGFLVVSLGVIIYLAFSIHASELQVVVHYTSFGGTNFYRDKWYYLLTYIAFIIVMAAVHSTISYKILQTKGREMAIAFLCLSFFMLFVATSLFYQLLKIASLS